MNEIPSDSYFENIQLIKLVSSAEALLQQLYKLVSYEDQQIIDQWLCFKREFDHCSNTKFSLNLDSNGNSIDDAAIHRDDEKSYTSEEYSESSIEEISSEREDSSDETCDQNVLSSGFESESHNDLDAYLRNFKTYTDSLVNGWFDNLNLGYANSCGDHIISNQYHNSTAQRPSMFFPNLPPNTMNPSFVPYNGISGFRFCHCCADGIGNCRMNLSLPIEEQIAFIREIKTPLIQSCQQINSRIKGCDFDTKHNEDLIMVQEVLELIDTTIEMKNNDFLAEFEMEKFKENNSLVYSSIMDCFKMLSSDEMYYLFVCLLNKLTTLRDNSSKLDKLILQLDNTIVDKEIRLRYLNKSYIKLRDVCTTLKNESKDIQREPVTDKLEAIINANNTSSSQNSVKDQAECSPVPSSSTIPNKSMKALHRSSLSKNFGVKWQGKKLIIQEDKNT